MRAAAGIAATLAAVATGPTAPALAQGGAQGGAETVDEPRSAREQLLEGRRLWRCAAFAHHDPLLRGLSPLYTERGRAVMGAGLARRDGLDALAELGFGSPEDDGAGSFLLQLSVTADRLSAQGPDFVMGSIHEAVWTEAEERLVEAMEGTPLADDAMGILFAGGAPFHAEGCGTLLAP